MEEKWVKCAIIVTQARSLASRKNNMTSGRDVRSEFTYIHLRMYIDLPLRFFMNVESYIKRI